jgi:hypothetical protein
MKKKECRHKFEYIPVGMTYKRSQIDGKINISFYNAQQYLKACTKCVYAKRVTKSEILR